MKKQSPPSPMIDDADLNLFRQSIAGAKQIKQDTVRFDKAPSKPKLNELAAQKKQHQSEFYFSDEYIPDIDTNGTVNYVKPGADRYLAKQLRRGDFAPELILDLHGLNKDMAKEELAALIHACKKQHYYCACVVHGIGEHVLKHKVPQYLVQHPDILAMHQAPLEYGGKGAVLILIDLPQANDFRR
ncbi:endonuclease SmrB [Pseudoalteromonas sp. S16_S37]|uniref:endonuclease SmrB n=1 Tax=Pseudoalteromonas sp. S16_S37 TaxID=2720228 RepID=UPI001680824A|nr:endonuclease SmrB [Pseudoalteromonas sp. S16_S37]MBD1582936.1 endonuclease SmrB [Pseudoalteromonas sp. S16_S37]